MIITTQTGSRFDSEKPVFSKGEELTLTGEVELQEWCGEGISMLECEDAFGRTNFIFEDLLTQQLTTISERQK